jgi:hypothetical protein
LSRGIIKGFGFLSVLAAVPGQKAYKVYMGTWSMDGKIAYLRIYVSDNILGSNFMEKKAERYIMDRLYDCGAILHEPTIDNGHCDISLKSEIAEKAKKLIEKKGCFKVSIDYREPEPVR